MERRTTRKRKDYSTLVAGEIRYIGKETDRKWEEGDDISVLDFKATEYGRAKKVISDESIGNEIVKVGIRKFMHLSKLSRITMRKLTRGATIKRTTLDYARKILQAQAFTIQEAMLP